MSRPPKFPPEGAARLATEAAFFFEKHPQAGTREILDYLLDCGAKDVRELAAKFVQSYTKDAAAKSVRGWIGLARKRGSRDTAVSKGKIEKARALLSIGPHRSAVSGFSEEDIREFVVRTRDPKFRIHTHAEQWLAEALVAAGLLSADRLMRVGNVGRTADLEERY